MQELEIPRLKGTLVEIATEKLRKALGHEPFNPGTQLPSEPELAKLMQVSRSTLRAALHTLELEGAILRRPGIGTFVSELPLLEYNLGRLCDLTDLISSMGHEPGLRLVSVRARHANQHVADRLGIAVGEKVVRIERIRTADGKPVVHHLEFFPKRCLDHTSPSLGIARLADLLRSRKPFLEVFMETLGVCITGAVATLKPVLATRELAEKLGVEPGAPLLRIEEVAHDREHKPLLLSFEHHVPELCAFSIYRIT